MERKEGVGVEERENRRRIRKKRISVKSAEWKMRGKREEKRKIDKEKNLAV